MVRLQWYGLYHDKPKVGTSCCGSRCPAASSRRRSSAPSASSRTSFGRGYGELTTRQNVQLHWIELATLPEVFAALDGAGLTTAGGCGDAVRNITGCPVAGIDADELFDCADRRSTRRPSSSTATRDYSDLPRKHKITIAACAAPVQRAGDQLHRADRRDPGRARPGFARARRRRALLDARASRATWASSCRRTRRSRCSRAILDVWRTTSRTASRGPRRA